jgi:hypothetical protein
MVLKKINLSEDTNSILDIVKKKHKFKNMSEALNFVVDEYEQNLLEINPKYLKKLEKISKGKFISFNSIGDLRKKVEHSR